MTEQRGVTILLYPTEYTALIKQSEQERRDPNQQAAWNVHFALVTLGFLKDESFFEPEEER